jgi:hypothetical protein
MHANLIPFSLAAGLNPYACLGASYGPTEVQRMLLFPSKKKIPIPLIYLIPSAFNLNLKRSSTSYSDAQDGNLGKGTKLARRHF